MSNLIDLSNLEGGILEQITELSSVKFGPREIAISLGFNIKQFYKQYNDKDSSIRQAYEKGKLETLYAILSKNKELAMSGNITSAQVYLKETKELEIAEIRNRILFGHEI